MEQDPYVKKLKSDPESCDIKKLNRVYLDRKTYCQEQLKNLYNRAQIVERELGLWAVHWYFNACLQKFQRSCDDQSAGLGLLDGEEKLYLKQCLGTFMSCVSQEPLLPSDSALLSNKVLRLIDFLTDEQKPGFTGLIFVRTRAEVAVLSELLANHPKTANFYTVSTFVGASNAASHKTNIGELVDVRNQVNTLDDLRFGRRNLVITTSALEEGIDVAACNMVICFDKPANLKSLIQRRGRARQSKSTFAIMLAGSDNPSTVATWEQLEEHMRQLYEDDMRRLREIEALEATDEGYRELVVEKTGAKILLSDAVSHLYHFCATLSTRQFGSLAPVFLFQEGSGGFTATVSLPISVDASVREAQSSSTWPTEKAAKRDAAFEAYTQLYRAGLLSDNLLPIRGYDEAVEEAKAQVGTIASLIRVNGQVNPWHMVASHWQEKKDLAGLHCFEVALHRNDEITATMQMLMPCTLPAIPSIELYWDTSTKFIATVRPSMSLHPEPRNAQSAIQSTTLLLSSVFRSRMNADKTDFLALFVPSADFDPISWTTRFFGTIRGDALQHVDSSSLSLSKLGIVRDLTQSGAAHILKGFQEVSPQADDDTCELQLTNHDEAALLLQVSRFPKRTDFLHSILPPDQSTQEDLQDASEGRGLRDR